MAESAATEDALTLDYVFGLNAATLGALGGSRVAYATGNIGVIADTASKAQTLLRGHVRRERGDACARPVRV
jgi:hypothetical protein